MHEVMPLGLADTERSKSEDDGVSGHAVCRDDSQRVVRDAQPYEDIPHLGPFCCKPHIVALPFNCYLDISSPGWLHASIGPGPQVSQIPHQWGGCV